VDFPGQKVTVMGAVKPEEVFCQVAETGKYTEFWPEEPKKVVAKKEGKKEDKPKVENKEEKKEEKEEKEEAAKEGKEVGFTSLPLGKLQLV
jgi:hypothetical protein